MNLEEIKFQHLSLNDLPLLLEFTNKWIGQNYFSLKDLETIYYQSLANGLNSSIIAWNKNQIVGIRLTLAPGKWVENQKKLFVDKWGVDKDRVAYFQSLFVDEDFQGFGLGPILSKMSIEILKKMGTQAIVCLSWLESPNNSSQKYLIKSGFKEIGRHEKFWNDKDYQCIRCSPNRCVCTAVEMILLL